MFSEITPFLAGKIDGLLRRKALCPYEVGSVAAADYAAGYQRGLSIS
jgi:hypothetical protein